MRLVAVEWYDAADDDGEWKMAKDVDMLPVQSFSAGWLLKRTKTHIVLCNTWNDFGATSGRIVIPTRMLKRVRYV